MKKLSITSALLLALVFSAYSQADSMYVNYGGNVTVAIATSQIDSLTFYRPAKIVDTTRTIATIGDFRDGGVVFWVDPTDNTKGLVVDLNDLSSSAPWGCSATLISGADDKTIGAGAQNTIDIEAGCSEVGTAADLCSNSTNGGNSDWFLPSKDELNEMFKNRTVIDGTAITNGGIGFSSSFYWSSTEFDGTAGFMQYFQDGNPMGNSKTSNLYVRSVRAF